MDLIHKNNLTIFKDFICGSPLTQSTLNGGGYPSGERMLSSHKMVIRKMYVGCGTLWSFLFCFLAKQIPMAWMAGPYHRAVRHGGIIPLPPNSRFSFKGVGLLRNAPLPLKFLDLPTALHTVVEEYFSKRICLLALGCLSLPAYQH